MKGVDMADVGEGYVNRFVDHCPVCPAPETVELRRKATTIIGYDLLEKMEKGRECAVNAAFTKIPKRELEALTKISNPWNMVRRFAQIYSAYIATDPCVRTFDYAITTFEWHANHDE